jgi:DNA-binding LacI/PurR family transcriptional regulator
MQNVEAARAGTEYLLGLGHRRIAVVGAHRGEVVGSAGLRLQGYRQALESAGVPFDPALIGYAGLWHRQNGAIATRQLLESGVQFDAIFGFNDSLALGSIRVLQEAGIRVPAQVSVLGFDDTDEAQYSVPSLTTVNPGVPEIVETAVGLLVERMGRPSDEQAAPREVYAAFHIVERESTAAHG